MRATRIRKSVLMLLKLVSPFIKVDMTKEEKFKSRHAECKILAKIQIQILA